MAWTLQEFDDPRAQVLALAQAVGDALEHTLAERGHAVLFKGERVLLALPPVKAPTPTARSVRGQTSTRETASITTPTAGSEHLFEQLRALRKRLADARGVPPYVIFHDTTLREMAAARPTSRATLLRLRGVGERKAADFGDEFLACIQAFEVAGSG